MNNKIRLLSVSVLLFLLVIVVIHEVQRVNRLTGQTGGGDCWYNWNDICECMIVPPELVELSGVACSTSEANCRGGLPVEMCGSDQPDDQPSAQSTTQCGDRETITVPATSNVWLTWASPSAPNIFVEPNHTDVVANHKPVIVDVPSELELVRVKIEATGEWGYGPGVTDTADGSTTATNTTVFSQYIDTEYNSLDIIDINVPASMLVGLWDTGGPTIGGEIFPIGTSFEGDIPSNAGELSLGFADSFGWYNNDGEVELTITWLCEAASVCNFDPYGVNSCNPEEDTDHCDVCQCEDGYTSEFNDTGSRTGICCIDTDLDRFCDRQDNCPDDVNPGQEDEDDDGIGDACAPPCSLASGGDCNPGGNNCKSDNSCMCEDSFIPEINSDGFKTGSCVPDPNRAVLNPECGDRIRQQPLSEECDQGSENGTGEDADVGGKPICCDGISSGGGCTLAGSTYDECTCPGNSVPAEGEDINGNTTYVCKCPSDKKYWTGTRCVALPQDCKNDGECNDDNDCTVDYCDESTVPTTNPPCKRGLPGCVATCRNANACTTIKGNGKGGVDGDYCIDTKPKDDKFECAWCKETEEKCIAKDKNDEPVCCAPGACNVSANGYGFCAAASPSGCSSDGECQGQMAQGSSVCQDICSETLKQKCVCSVGFCVNILDTSCTSGGNTGGTVGGGGTPGGGSGGGTTGGGSTGGTEGGATGGDTGGTEGGTEGGDHGGTEGGDTGGGGSSTSSEAVSSIATSEVSSIAQSSSEVSQLFSSAVFSSSQHSGFFSSIPPKLCGNGVVDTGEDCDNGSICSQDEYRTCTNDSDCNVCAFVGITDVARCGGVDSGKLCSKQSDCIDGDFTCEYDIEINPQCSDQCTLPQASSEFTSSIPSPESSDSSEIVVASSVASEYRVASSVLSSNTSSPKTIIAQASSVNVIQQTDDDDNRITVDSDDGGIIGGSHSCGNGRIERLETCDDGNRVSGDGCSSRCITEDDEGNEILSGAGGCGNGRIERLEQCDDGNRNNGDGCDSQCLQEVTLITPSPTLVAAASVCGNGVLEDSEECDDTNRRDSDGCSSTCLLEIGICGDGIVQTLLGEQCEGSDGCDNCRFFSPTCGDGNIDAREECDNGPQNSTSPDAACRPDCSMARCGDAIVDTQELCDDGNRQNGDGCDRFCRTEEKETLVAGEVSIPSTPPSEPQQVKFQQPQQQLQFPQFPSGQPVPYQLPLAQLQPLIAQQGPVGDTGPAAVAVGISGIAAGIGWMRRKKR